jgi:hypothetical protein
MLVLPILQAWCRLHTTARTGAVDRWAMLVLALLIRVLCNERSSDISLYHLGCFKLQAPDHSTAGVEHPPGLPGSGSAAA